MSFDTEVIIIGAGPAGLMAAKTLAQSDIEYMLIDRSKRPGESKPCGGFIPVSTLKQFSIPRIEGQHRIDSVRMLFPGKDLVHIQFNECLGVNVKRENLSATLLKSVPNSNDRATLGTNVDKVETSPDSCKVTISNGDSKRTLSSRLVIDASGTNPVSQRFIQLRERIPNNMMGYGLQYHIEMDEELGHSNAFLYGSSFSPGGYCWIFPRGRVAVIGTGGLVSRIRQNEKRVHEYLDYLLREVEPIKNELMGGRIIKKDSALMPLCGIIRPSFGKRILLAGDANGHCSPISGEGIHYSMVGGQSAALTAIRCIHKDDFSDKMLSKYEKRWITQMGSDLKWGDWLQRKLMKPGTANDGGWSTTGFIDSEKSQRIIAQMLMGARSIRKSIIAVAPSYLKSKIKM
jgi:digeranylgeranylglycerophospholipid reductase